TFSVLDTRRLLSSSGVREGRKITENPAARRGWFRAYCLVARVAPRFLCIEGEDFSANSEASSSARKLSNTDSRFNCANTRSCFDRVEHERIRLVPLLPPFALSLSK